MIRKFNLQGLLENMAFGMYFLSSSVRYFGKAHLGRTVDGPEIVKQLSSMHENIKEACNNQFNIPASSGPGINRNRLCSFRRGWTAIICPSLPNCNLYPGCVFLFSFMLETKLYAYRMTRKQKSFT